MILKKFFMRSAFPAVRLVDRVSGRREHFSPSSDASTFVTVRL